MKKLLLDRLAAYLLGGTAWGQIQAVIHIVEDPNTSGAQKRDSALEMLKTLGLGLAGFMLNLGLELAVAKLRMD